ncbi:MAG TPA: ABC transporter permease [Stellaceae bacterium]|nr:ABC transporter permease [Stellaceae bacterium]
MQILSSKSDAAVTAEVPRPSRATPAARDLVAGLGKSWLWTAMAMQDIRLRYRGSLLGPFWITLSTAVMVGVMGVIYPHLFHTDVRSYLPFLAIGIVVWQFIQTVIIDSCQVFLDAQGVILQAPLPFSIHVYRMVARNFIVLAHNLVIIPAVLVILRVPIGLSALQIVPALTLIAINGVWLGILFGMISARFRDIPPIVASVVQVLFFITPIFWSPEVLGKWERLFELNPIFAAIDVIRAPLLGKAPVFLSWPVLAATTVIGSTLTFAFFARFRSRIAYWI